MKNRLVFSLIATLLSPSPWWASVASVTSLTFDLPAEAETTRLSRPSDRIQQAGIDYNESSLPAAQDDTVRGGQMKNGTVGDEPLSSRLDYSDLQASASNHPLRGNVVDLGSPPLSLRAASVAPQPQANLLPKSAAYLNAGTRQLSSTELSQLGRHDIVLVVDKSSSMGEIDCPSLDRNPHFISRWVWCRDQATDLANQASQVLPQGISVLLFSWTTRIFPHVDFRDIPKIFADNHPDGVTNEANALGAVLDDYFQRRAAAHGKVLPLLIAIITDGRPTSESAVRSRIIEATRSMRNADEIKITFLLIGQDQKGLQFIEEMDKGLTFEGAKFDIVSSKRFPELVQSGLASALVDCISSSAPSFPVADYSKHKKLKAARQF
jgi:Mg-chelatase subunit ChlD